MKLSDLETVITEAIVDAMEDTRRIDREYIAQQHAMLAAREIHRKHRPTYIVTAP